MGTGNGLGPSVVGGGPMPVKLAPHSQGLAQQQMHQGGQQQQLNSQQPPQQSFQHGQNSAQIQAGKWVDPSGRPKMAESAANKAGGHNVGSGAENEGSGNKPNSASSSTADKNGDVSDGQDTGEQEKQMAWKKEKRRKQNREAQRRRRDRLMNQHRQKQAESDDPPGNVPVPGQGIGGSGNVHNPYMMPGGGMELFNMANGMQQGGKDDQFSAGGFNMAMRYGGEMGGGQLQSNMPNMSNMSNMSNMAMLQKQLSFGAGMSGGMQGWNYNAMHGNMLGQGLQYGQVPQHSIHSQQGQHPQQSLQYQMNQTSRRADSFNFGQSNLGNIGQSLNSLAAMQGNNFHPAFWDQAHYANASQMGSHHALFNDKLVGPAGPLTKQGSFGAGLGSINVGGLTKQGTPGNLAAMVSQNSFSLGSEMNPLFKSGSFATQDFSAFLRQDSRSQVHKHTSIYCNRKQHTATHLRQHFPEFWVHKHTSTHRNTLQHTATYCNTFGSPVWSLSRNQVCMGGCLCLCLYFCPCLCLCLCLCSRLSVSLPTCMCLPRLTRPGMCVCVCVCVCVCACMFAFVFVCVS